jgi:oligopeptide transport system permease protein
MKSAPGKPFQTERNPSPEVLAELHRKYDFTYPQYLEGILLHGDFRYSYSHRNSTVMEIIGEALPVSLELGAYALLIAVIVGLGAGLLSALYRGRWCSPSPCSASPSPISSWDRSCNCFSPCVWA